MNLNENIKFFENESCEHCGKLEAYDPVYVDEDSGIVWCIYCALANGDIDEETVELAAMAAVDRKIEYFNARIRKLREEDDYVLS
jgi:hypothetical protein